MSGTFIVAFLHHVAAFGLFALITHQHLAIKPGVSLQEAKRLMRIDILIGILAVLLLVVGLARVVHFEKGIAYYMQNPFFHAKFTFFILACLISIYPTVRFLRWRGVVRTGQTPTLSEAEVKKILMCMRGQLFCLVVMIFCAVGMARPL